MFFKCLASDWQMPITNETRPKKYLHQGSLSCEDRVVFLFLLSAPLLSSPLSFFFSLLIMTDVVTEFKRSGQWPNATEESRRQFRNVAWLVTGRGVPPEEIGDAGDSTGLRNVTDDARQASFLRRLAKITPKSDASAAECYVKHWDAIRKIQSGENAGERAVMDNGAVTRHCQRFWGTKLLLHSKKS